jgi:hypothetical protein
VHEKTHKIHINPSVIKCILSCNVVHINNNKLYAYWMSDEYNRTWTCTHSGEEREREREREGGREEWGAGLSPSLTRVRERKSLHTLAWLQSAVAFQAYISEKQALVSTEWAPQSEHHTACTWCKYANIQSLAHHWKYGFVLLLIPFYFIYVMTNIISHTECHFYTGSSLQQKLETTIEPI